MIKQRAENGLKTDFSVTIRGVIFVPPGTCENPRRIPYTYRLAQLLSNAERMVFCRLKIQFNDVLHSVSGDLDTNGFESIFNF